MTYTASRDYIRLRRLHTKTFGLNKNDLIRVVRIRSFLVGRGSIGGQATKAALCHDGERGAFKSERTKLARTTEAVIRATTYIPQNNTSNEVLFCGGVRAT